VNGGAGEWGSGGTGEMGERGKRNLPLSRSPLSHSVVADAAAWDAALLSLPSPHILQSWAWSELKAQTGWRAKRLVWQSAVPYAVASLLVRRLDRRLPVAVAYIPKGPILDWSNASLVKSVLARSRLRRGGAGAVFVKDRSRRAAADVDPGSSCASDITPPGWRPPRTDPVIGIPWSAI